MDCQLALQTLRILIAQSIQDGGQQLSTLFRKFSFLSHSFSHVRDSLQAFHKREKDRYDLGAVEHLFKPGDSIRVRIKTRYKGPAKFAPSYSGPHEVISVRGVILTVRELSTNRVYQIHHDRASNPLLTPSFDRGPASDPIDSDPDPEPKDANPIENEREPGENLEPASNPDNSLIRTRSGEFRVRIVILTMSINLPLIEVSLVPSQSASSHTNPSRSNASRRHANFEPSALLQSMQTQAEIIDALEDAGERVCFLVDRNVNAMLLRETGTLYVFDEPKNDFVSLCDGRTLTNDRKRQRASRPPNFRELSADDVLLPWQEIDFPGFAEGRHKRRYYGFTPEWRNYAIQQAKEEKSCSEPAPPTTAQPEPEPERESRPEREPEPEPEPTVAADPQRSRSRTPSGSQHQQSTRTSEY